MAADSQFTTSTLTGFAIAVEIGDWDRFTGASIGTYLGLVPTEHSSGGSRRQGAITTAGRSCIPAGTRPPRPPGPPRFDCEPRRPSRRRDARPQNKRSAPAEHRPAVPNPRISSSTTCVARPAQPAPETPGQHQEAPPRHPVMAAPYPAHLTTGPYISDERDGDVNLAGFCAGPLDASKFGEDRQ
jgi:hypothetical protein